MFFYCVYRVISVFFLILFFCSFVLIPLYSQTTDHIFTKVKITGILLGKDKYAHYYLLTPGNPFDEKKHAESLDKITTVLKEEGYFNAKIVDKSEYDSTSNTVSVALNLQPGKRFIIDDVQVTAKSADKDAHVEKVAEQIARELQAKLKRLLINSYYVQELINREAQAIQTKLIRKGYVHAEIGLTTKKNVDKHSVTLYFSLVLPKQRVVTFRDNTNIDTQSLLEEIQRLEKQGIEHPDILKEHLVLLYRKKGFLQIHIDVDTQTREHIFTIQEGDQAVLHKVTFMRDNCVIKLPVEAESTQQKYSVQTVLIDVAKKLQYLQLYDEDAVKQILYEAELRLSDFGYWDARIAQKEMRVRSKPLYEIVLTVTLGEQRKIKRIILENFPEILNEPVFKRFKQQETSVLPVAADYAIQVRKKHARKKSHEEYVKNECIERESAQVLSLKYLDEQKQCIEAYVKSKGYLYAVTDYTIEQDVLTWHVDTRGGQVRFGETTICGLQRTKLYCVERELAYQEGDLWCREKVEETVARLKRLNIFESVSIRPQFNRNNGQFGREKRQLHDQLDGQTRKQVNGQLDERINNQFVDDNGQRNVLLTEQRQDALHDNSALQGENNSTSISSDESLYPQTLPMLITCIEDDPFEIRTRLGYQFVSKSFTRLEWSTWKVGGSFLWKNPSGIADQLAIDADFTRYTRCASATYSVPWLGNWPVRTFFRAYSEQFDQPLVSNAREHLYKESHDGFSATFHHDSGCWHSCLKTGFEFNKLSDISERIARVIQFEPTLINQRIPYLYFEPSLVYDNVDNKVDPCRGFYTSLSLKAMIPPTVSDAWFVRALIKQSYFHPLVHNVIGAFHWQFGHIFNSRFRAILPTERFYLGGACSLRGYETNMVPPLNDLRCDDCCFWVPVGGKTMANVIAELRFPLYRRLSGVIFTDMGVLAQDTFADIAANKWLGATGFGLRLATPLGPIRFDIGWKWRKRVPTDKQYAWFLTLGHAF